MILVDGYNLMGQEAGALSGLSLEKERENLVRKLEQLSAVSGERFLVVFDGSLPAAEGSSAKKTSSAQSPVSIAFSKAGQTADGWILKYLSRRPSGSAILITRDWELAQKAKKSGFKVETDLNRLEAKAEPYLAQPISGSQTGGDLLSAISPKSREALAQARKKSKTS
jgi:predicted RNA-binding protein with PIN domain